MKTFLNVLYRRILYKIPLKLLLFLLAVFGVLFACFSSAEDVQGLVTYLDEQSITIAGGNYHTILSSISSSNYGTYCVELSEMSSNNGNIPLSFGFNNSNAFDNNLGYRIYTSWDDNGTIYACLPVRLSNMFFYNSNGNAITLKYKLFKLNALLNTDIPVYTSIQCQTEYNLIPISSVDQNYCTSNNLCPSCPVCPSVPVGTGGYSQLYINNILHLGAPNIIMNIPDEIDWDYAYTQGGQNMNIDVVGYNVDYEKIDSIVQFQNYKPSSDDFQKIIGLLAPYTKIIVFFVFLFIVWAWIKKPFKSKKL